MVSFTRTVYISLVNCHEYSAESLISNYRYYHMSTLFFRAYTKMAANPRAQQLGSYSASTSSMSNMFSQLVITGHKYVMEGMKNFVVGPKVSHSSLSLSLSPSLSLIHSLLPSSISNGTLPLSRISR